MQKKINNMMMMVKYVITIVMSIIVHFWGIIKFKKIEKLNMNQNENKIMVGSLLLH